MPFGLKSLAEPPKMGVSKLLRELRSWSQVDLPIPDGTLMSMAYEYIPNMEANEWVPPFTGLLVFFYSLMFMDDKF